MHVFPPGPPFPPETPQLTVVNATSLLLSWKRPFSWLPKYPILMYGITVLINSSIASTNVSNETHELLYTREVLEGHCEEVAFTITAINSIGASYSSTPTKGKLPLGVLKLGSLLILLISYKLNHRCMTVLLCY